MVKDIKPHTAAEIVTTFQEAAAAVRDLCADIPEDKFNQRVNDKWSPGQNLQHLIKSTVPLAQALNMPTLALRGLGKPNRPVRDYDQLVQRYHERLEQTRGQSVKNPYAAKERDDHVKDQLMAEWDKAVASLVKAIEKKWTDEQKLDKYLLPHPLLGKIMVREMLFFTVFHTWHHRRAIQFQVDNF